MKTQEILKKYLKYYEEKDHKQIPNVSLVPEGDSTLLFVNSGMFPLVPYLSGEPHPLGKRLTNIQRAIRLEDIDEIGDAVHTLAFHMIGNWSLGDYFKGEQLPWIYDFLINEIKLDPEKFYASVFAGDDRAPKDDTSEGIIREIFSKYEVKTDENRITFTTHSNWWQRGDSIGELGGPDSEVFYYIGTTSPDGKNPIEHEEEFIEIGNSVFMQYRKTEFGWEELPQKNVDFGGGLERLAMVVQGKNDIFETDNFWPIIEELQKLTNRSYSENEDVKKSMRIIADHIRAAVFLAMDGVIPSNKEHGYILRRIIRRIVRSGRLLGITEPFASNLVKIVADMFEWLYTDLPSKVSEIKELLSEEEQKFTKLINKVSPKVIAELNSANIDTEGLAKLAVKYYQSWGYPTDVFINDMEELNIVFDVSEFREKVRALTETHQVLSREGADQKFKGGLADKDDTTVKYHTMTHLLQASLKKILGDRVHQLGSNITVDRFRFDFNYTQKLSNVQIKDIQDFINKQIKESLPVSSEVLPIDEAKKSGASFLPNEKYPEKVKIYYIGKSLEDAISKELCGGPHVKNTSELKPVEIFKQDKIGKAALRIYARFT